MAVSADERERFERDGYLIFDPEIPETVLDDVVSEVEDKYLRGKGTRVDEELGIVYAGGPRPRTMDLWKICENVRRVALTPKIMAVCEELYGRRPLPFQTLNLSTGSQQRPHADAMHFTSDPPGYMCGVWVALEDIDKDNGPLLYFPGSQTLPVPSWDEIGEPGENTYPDYEDFGAWMQARHEKYESYAESLIERHGFKAEQGIIPKGHALLWSANLIHGGAPQLDNTRTRHSQVTHYYFEGCRYYSPMRTEESRQFWKYPWWIRSEGVTDETSAIRDVVNDCLPGDATVLVMGNGRAELDLGDRNALQLPVVNDAEDAGSSLGDSTAVRELKRLRSEGADYLLVPRHELPRLAGACNNLQQHLEASYRAIVRDGGSCAIYDLRSA